MTENQLPFQPDLSINILDLIGITAPAMLITDPTVVEEVRITSISHDPGRVAFAVINDTHTADYYTLFSILNNEPIDEEIRNGFIGTQPDQKDLDAAVKSALIKEQHNDRFRVPETYGNPFGDK